MALKFHKDICQQLLQEDGLVVMSAGLGIHDILVRFIKLYSNSDHLVFVLNTKSERQLQICCELQAEGVSKLPTIITDSTADDRFLNY